MATLQGVCTEACQPSLNLPLGCSTGGASSHILPACCMAAHNAQHDAHRWHASKVQARRIKHVQHKHVTCQRSCEHRVSCQAPAGAHLVPAGPCHHTGLSHSPPRHWPVSCRHTHTHSQVEHKQGSAPAYAAMLRDCACRRPGRPS